MSRKVAQGVIIRQKVLLEIWSLGYFYVPSEWLTKTYKLGPATLNLWRNRGIIFIKIDKFRKKVTFLKNYKCSDYEQGVVGKGNDGQ